VTALALDAPTVAQLARILERDRATMPVAEALTRRLGVDSWMLRLDEAGRLRGVVVLGPTRPPPFEPPAPAAPPVRAPPPGDLLDGLHAVPAGGVLARLLGAGTATGRQLADLTLRHDDPDVRGEAVGVLVDAVLADPAREQAVLGAIEAVDDATLARQLTGLASDATASLLSVVVERARGRPLGRRAARVYELLGGG
jgi:hypothetical protein